MVTQTAFLTHRPRSELGRSVVVLGEGVLQETAQPKSGGSLIAVRIRCMKKQTNFAERKSLRVDTDSMAIVATEQGGTTACPAGDRKSIQALSWQQVKEISEKFDTLNPYDRSAVPDSILKIEDDNRDPISQKQREIYCFAI
jgi:hypothetical protein